MTPFSVVRLDELVRAFVPGDGYLLLDLGACARSVLVHGGTSCELAG
jgi:hypothetical protein